MHLYTPLLQAKEGEFNALANLDHLDKIKTIPLIQLLPDTNTKRKGNYVKDRIKPLLKSWAFLDNRIYVDPQHLGPTITVLHSDFFDKLKDGLVNVIPVIHIDSNIDNFRFAVSHSVLGICLRVTIDQMNSDSINRRIEDITNLSSLGIGDIDLILDFGLITKAHETIFYDSFVNIFSQIKNKNLLRKIIVASGSLPSDLGKIPKDTVRELPRIEWNFWKSIKKSIGNQASPVYGDYGIVSPIYDPEVANHAGTCSIKYSDTDNFVIFRGELSGNSPYGNKQYQRKAADLVSRPFYSGENFSWGDSFIMKCANAQVPPGSPGSWVKVAQNHHFAKMLRLLA